MFTMMSSAVRLLAPLLLLLFFTVPEPGSCEVEVSGVLEPYDLLFDNAVEAYYKQDWLSVILNMERALRTKETVRSAKARCRRSCADLAAFQSAGAHEPVPLPGAGPVEDLGFFQRILQRADCMRRCEAEKLGPSSVHKISDEVELEFKKRTPYNYLQVAYFKINKLDKAVAAANTFYIANPDHMEMRQNLEYYGMMAGVQDTDYKDLEARPHMDEFLEGKRLYSADDFPSSIGHFEKALEEYFDADAECRALCEGEYDYDGYNYMEYSADLFQSITGKRRTDHYLYVLNCKQNCAVELASTPGSQKPFEDFLPSHLNYLQFSYYNSEQYEKAIECAKTFLLFYPDDQVMKQNLAYYSVILGEEKAAAITARKVVEQYIKNSLLEKELLYFGYEIFGIAFVDPDTWTPEEIMPKKLRDKQKADRETAARITEEISNLMKDIETLVEEKNKESSDIATLLKDGVSTLTPPPEDSLVLDGITVSMTSKTLNGSQRVVMDGVITADECRELHRLSNTAAQKGDGYRGRPSPHSPSEMFQGVTILKTLKLGQEGVLPLKSARLFFDLSEKVRKVVESYFSLQSPLYFSYSHLVCRSAIEEKQEDRDDLSHPVHVDNCLLISELNECIKEPPAYTHRDYSAILYLNDDFEGGDFIFTELDAKTITAVVKPQCGRIVAFGAGKENPHGVRAVKRGQRCAVALWFTLDPRHDEKERIQAEELLKMLSSPLDADFQRSEEDRSDEAKPEKDSVKPDGEKTTTEKEEETKTPGEEQTSEKPEEKKETSTDSKAETKTVNKTKPPKSTPTVKSKAKTATKSKPAGKVKTKTKEAEKSKTADKKEKLADKKKTKTSSKQMKTKSSQSDSQKKKDEL
ncbi:prolyl 3-hydroxylase 1 [Silurus asotus]|uniref:procollagen-proline 3-dioxygenase n=1 Tax=Silurus asotus TaxID=30991 RepID=A0AAD5AWK8_SILAS|nr:prolyl 3-hydroxylase 1 [Silurus asotus]